MAWPEDARFLTHTPGGAVDAGTINELQDGLGAAGGPYLLPNNMFFTEGKLWTIAGGGTYYEWDDNGSVFAYFNVPIRAPNAKILRVDIKAYYGSTTTRDKFTGRLRLITTNHDAASTAPSQSDAATVAFSTGSGSAPTWDVLSMTGLSVKPTKDQLVVVQIDSSGTVDSASEDFRLAAPRIWLGWDAL